MRRPASVPRDGHGGQHRTSARADTDGKGEAGEEDEGENEDNVDDDSDVSALDQTWSASTNGLEASSDEDSEGGLPAVHSSGYAALTAEGVEDGRRANFNRHKGTSGAAVRRAAAGACRQTRSALRKCGQVDGQVEFVGWMMALGCGRDGSRSLELQKSVLASTAAVGDCTMPRGARSGAHAARPAAAQSSGAFCGSP